MMSHKPQTRPFEVLCDSGSTAGNQPLRDRRESVSPQSQPLRHLSVSQSQNRQSERDCVDIGLRGPSELRRVSCNSHWGAIQKNEKRVGGRRTRPSITPSTFEVLDTVAEPESQTQSIASASKLSDDAQRILQLPVNRYSSHPLSIAARDIPPLEEQLAKHRDGYFEWILAVWLPSDAKSQRVNSPGVTDSIEVRKVYFGCNLLPEPSLRKNKALKTNRPANSYSLLVTSLEETESVLDVFRDPVHEPGMALQEESLGHGTPVRTPGHASLSGVNDRTPNSTVCTRGDDSSSPSMIASSLGEYGTRIEDSFEALDILEDQLEAFDKDARFSQFVPTEKSHLAKEPLGKPELATPNLSVRFATPQPQRTFTRPSSALLQVKPATEPRRTALRKVTSMTFDSRKFKTEEKDLIQLSPINHTTRSTPQRPVGKSTKQLTVPTFELPGEAVARQLKEKKEARLASQRATQPTAASLRRSKSAKPPTRPTFELPGEAISRRKREEHQAQLKTQEEEERRRRAFKARPVPSHIAPTTVPRDTIASRARQNTATLTENSVRGAIPNKRPFTTAGPRSRPALSNTINQAQHRGRGPKTEQSPIHQTSRATSTSTNSLSGKRSSLSIEDVQMQRLRGHEIYQRDNSWNDTKMREKWERETLAKLAREEAAERSRQKSREWAEKQAKKRTTISSLRDVLV
ncbi:hypothetical protein F4803DRAFT_428718 [Xylaria telfairii]|nr:hypothetical protein F4803DRAFT_428718 [Xylaria telfairii]